MEINKYYHREQAAAEEREHYRRIEEGIPVRIGAEYTAVTARNGWKHEGPFAALAYESGLLMVGKPDRRVFAFISEDVVADRTDLYTEHLPTLVKFKNDLSDILGNLWEEEECCMALRRASAVKWMCPLSMPGAQLLYKWHRKAIEEEIRRLDQFDETVSLEDYALAIKRSLRISSWHYTEEQALECMEERASFIPAFYNERVSPWYAAMDIGYYCG